MAECFVERFVIKPDPNPVSMGELFQRLAEEAPAW
jgi:hypothetical protein